MKQQNQAKKMQPKNSFVGPRENEGIPEKYFAGVKEFFIDCNFFGPSWKNKLKNSRLKFTRVDSQSNVPQTNILPNIPSGIFVPNYRKNLKIHYQSNIRLSRTQRGYVILGVDRIIFSYKRNSGKVNALLFCV
jgi:hypothetical protein